MLRFSVKVVYKEYKDSYYYPYFVIIMNNNTFKKWATFGACVL